MSILNIDNPRRAEFIGHAYNESAVLDVTNEGGIWPLVTTDLIIRDFVDSDSGLDIVPVDIRDGKISRAGDDCSDAMVLRGDLESVGITIKEI